MKYIGAHVSAAGGVSNAPVRAAEIGATAFALFTKNQRQWKSKPLSESEIREFKAQMQKHGFTPKQVLPHDSYLINLGNVKDEQTRNKHLSSFVDEMQRVEQLGLDRLNFHPGSHLNELTTDAAMQKIAEGIGLGIRESSGVYAVIEITAGQGTNLGFSFEQLAQLIDLIPQQDRIGVCLDTCHMFAGGYDLRQQEAYDAVMAQFQKLIGFELLMGMHLNDAKSSLGSRVDRHASLGRGELGIEPFSYIMQDERMDEIPFILETVEPELWPEEIRTLKEFAHG